MPAPSPVAATVAEPIISPGVVWAPWNIARAEREARSGHRAAVLWFTGLPGSGKSTLAQGLERRLFQAGHQTMLLDGDQLRHGLCGDLAFTPQGRAENIRRAGHAARLFFEQGCLVLCAFVSPFREAREEVRELIGPDRFLEIFVDCPLDECRRRDPKGLYARAQSGQVSNLTGVGQPYEPPLHPAFTALTLDQPPTALIASLHSLLRQRGLIS